ncbi:hypothetical protein RJ639_008466 [Escallonia herrerae]|uniref:Uncharacterized protein n=1 Tax=Escallonia herrerae TaxID=1293975 RepID=A0AA89AS70_9ASTE|nr:hypothetical protein RJ639_008466 [Escallonia herrerae]
MAAHARSCYAAAHELNDDVRTSFEIPKLCIYDSTEPFLRNLIAFEQCSPSQALAAATAFNRFSGLTKAFNLHRIIQPASNHKTEATRQDLLHNSITKIMEDVSDEKAQLPFKASIYRVPQKLRKLKESAYTPCIVSIGSYHKHDERLKDKEDHKKSER